MLSRVHIYYGSQMGRTKGLAERTLQSLKEIERVHASLKSLDDFVHDSIETGHIALIVTSTFGMGGPPENAYNFHSMLTDEQKRFDGILYSVMGVGDSRWQTFCEFPRTVNSKLELLGAERCHQYGEIDVAEDDHEKKEEEWINSVVQTVSQLALQKSEEKPEVIEEDSCLCLHKSPDLRKEVKPRVVKRDKKIHTVPIQFARYLTNHHEKRIIHLGLDISNTDIRYKPGDCLAIFPENDPELVQTVLNHIESSGFEDDSHMQELKETLASQRDLNQFLNIEQLSGLASFVKNETEFNEAQTYLTKFDSKTLITLVSFLKTFKSTKLPEKWTLDNFPLMSARYYSISCSPLVFPDAVHVVFTVVDVPFSLEAFGSHRQFHKQGTSTSHLERLCKQHMKDEEETETVFVKVSLRTSNTFTLPADLSQHVLMVGAGTGVAPFRGFLQHLCFLRQKELGSLSATPKAFGCDSCPLNLLELLGNNKQVLPDLEDKPKGITHSLGKNWLFFGCRHPDLDFLFQDEFEALSDSGTLDVLEIAFSRNVPSDNSQYKYAQHLLHKKEREIVDLLMSRKGYLFVCGNFTGMTHDTHQKLVAIFSRQRGVTSHEAEALLEQLASEKRYVRESWLI